MAVKITIRPNGPYVVEGEVELFDVNGTKIDTSDRPRIALCRCGGSVTKPYCDGTHSMVGFPAADAAVQQETKKRPSGRRRDFFGRDVGQEHPVVDAVRRWTAFRLGRDGAAAAR
jgi:CDGSH-type Zn-finger protein